MIRVTIGKYYRVNMLSSRLDATSGSRSLEGIFGRLDGANMVLEGIGSTGVALRDESTGNKLLYQGEVDHTIVGNQLVLLQFEINRIALITGNHGLIFSMEFPRIDMLPYIEGTVSESEFQAEWKSLLKSQDVTIIDGDKGNVLAGLDNDDLILGHGGNDQLWGRGGDDTLRGNEANDTLAGGTGDDTLSGGAGADDLRGGGGNDVMIWSGDVRVDGGLGLDTLRVVSNLDLTTLDEGTIVNVDRVELVGFGLRLTLSASDVLAMSENGKVTVLGDTIHTVELVGGFSQVGTSGGLTLWRHGAAVVKIDDDFTVIA